MEIGKNVSVVLGRSGLGWGKGIHDSSNIFHYPIKIEGDGRSPAGIFNLSSVFGYAPEEQINNLKMPYTHITEIVECIDDVNSEYYNQIVRRDKIEKEKVDWESSEKMYFYDIYYELGVIVDHNIDPIEKGAGCCIFLHNWSNPNETMSDCTAMEPTNMQEIIQWLNIDNQPVLVQLTKHSYIALVKKWALPDIIDRL